MAAWLVTCKHQVQQLLKFEFLNSIYVPNNKTIFTVPCVAHLYCITIRNKKYNNMQTKKILPLFVIILCVFAVAAKAQTFQYDAKNQLTKVTYSNGASISYTYDAVGNRISETSSIATQAVVAKTFAAAVIESKLTIRPNPVNNLLYVDGLTKNINSFEVVNAAGIVVKRWGATGSRQLDVSGLANGFYLLLINNTTTLKFIKQ